ncbi:MAG: phosphoribosylformylglycinamidine synthase subunit PurQ [Alphaproteobacteria bacterium]
MKAAVIVYPGSNCDRDVRVALANATGVEPLAVWHRESAFPEVDLIVLPGGFSYGDYLRAGAMAAHSPVMREIRRRAEKGVRVLGICNGFQILTETGLLPGALLQNASIKFVCRDVHLRVETSESAFTGAYRAGEVLRIPIAHRDGNYFADPETLNELEGEGRIAFRYCGPEGDVRDEANPNGSIANIAGVFSKDRRVLGMMPHPERLAEPMLGGEDGKRMFEGLVAALS